ncbi:MAG: DUF992 domain-containing protein [Rhizobiaceae bacterium]|nr:DUF992 domain-containing protein [Rhizobiaceae bacterium]
MRNNLIAAAAAVAVMTASAPAAHAFGNTEIGILVCQVESGSGFVFGSTKTVDCTFTPSNGSAPERYSGAISRWGVDLGFTSNGLLKWGVLATGFDAYGPGSLSGRYAGIGAEVTAALGVGTNVLGKKSTRDFVLQPISVQGQTGLNVAVGIAEFELHSALK